MSFFRVGVTLCVIALIVFVTGAWVNSFWYDAALNPVNLYAPAFLSVALDFDGPYDDNTYWAGAFNLVALVLLSIGAVLCIGHTAPKSQ